MRVLISAELEATEVRLRGPVQMYQFHSPSYIALFEGCTELHCTWFMGWIVYLCYIALHSICMENKLYI